MKLLCYLACGLLLPGTAAAQNFVTVKPDTRFPVALRQTVRASRAKVGHTVEFRTLEPILIGGGIVVPENATLFGEVAFVRSDPRATPRSWIRIVVNSLHWKTGTASLNAVVDSVFYARSTYFGDPYSGPRPTFLEGIHIQSHLFRHASTDFFSDSKEVILREGILLEMRHFVSVDNEMGETLSAASALGR